jgi:type II secretory pathway pseudopilin PulG
MKPKALPFFARRRCSRAAFTLTEILIASAIAAVVVAGVLAVVLAVTKSSIKTQFLATALQNSREVQEYLKRETAAAVNNVDGAARMGLWCDIPNGSGRYAQMTYRVPVSTPLRVTANALKSEKSITVDVPAGVALLPGDYVVIPSPFTGENLRVVSAPNGDTATNRQVTVTFNKTIADATIGVQSDLTVTAKVDVYVAVFREGKFEVDDPGAAAVTTLRWWSNAADDATERILSTQVAATERYMFEPVPNDLADANPAKIHSVRWHFVYAGANTSSNLLPGNQQFWDRNVSDGELWARSGDPERPEGGTSANAYVPLPDPESTTTAPTTSIVTTSIATTSTTSIPTTSTSKTTTTKTTTTSIKTTSTTKTTTTSIKTTSTTKTTTTSIKTTSTTKPSTTSVKTTTTTSVPTTAPTTKPTTTTPTTKPPTTMQDG